VTGPAYDLGKLKLDRDPPPAVRRAFGRNLILVAVLLVVVAAGALFVRRGSAPQVQTIVATLSQPAGGSVAAGAVSVTANGYVAARTRASVSAKVPGRLASLTVDEGSTLKKGDIIARLENADYQAAVAEAQASLASARAQVIEARAERDQMRREAARMRNLKATNPGLIAEQDVDAAESRAAQTEARTGSAEARVEAASASLRFAQANLDNTYIRAPFAGTVLRKEAEVGEVVAPSVGGGLTRGAVVTLADLGTLEVEVDVNEAYIARIRHEQEARITLDAYPDTSFRGTVRQVVPTADRQRATVQVKVSITDHDPRILPEMGARVDFLEQAREGPMEPTAGATRFRLPASAVREREGKTVVWLIRDGKLEAREVSAGPVSGGFREIRSGLSGGEMVLTGGVDAPTPGMRVKTGP
jgi:HlyD family secretion protein